MRVDLSEQLIHLTRGSLSESEVTFRSILKDRCLKGSNNQIRGSHKVVCFSESPVEILAKVFTNNEGRNFQYRPFGVMVPKKWLFDKGGRPVIYQPESEYQDLPEKLQYRHVRFDCPGGEKDFTFEREWRIATEILPLEPSNCTIIVPDREWDYRLREEHAARDMTVARLTKYGPFTRMSKFEWHVLALGDIGAKFPINDS